MNNMIYAGFISSAPQWPWYRQFPDSIPTWDGVEFKFSGDFSDCDIVFVYDAIPDSVSEKIEAQRAVFVCSEPPNVKLYRSDFLRQFDKVLTSYEIKHPHTEIGQLGLPWLVGAYSSDGSLLKRPMLFNDFEVFEPRKTKLISVVSSNKAFTPEHRQRLHFVEKLKSHFGENLDYFGRNINGFSDKLDVLSEYKYHISLENCHLKNYWTEKLSDPILTLTYPIYYGCPNINDYFPGNSITKINIADAPEAMEIIEGVIASNKYEASLDDMYSARQLILRQYNIFSMLSRVAAEQLKTAPGKRRPLTSENILKERGNVGKSLKRKLARIFRKEII